MQAIFLDRDGVICENRSNHVKSWQEFHFLPEVKNSILALSQLGFPLIVVTNQAIVGRGVVTASIVDEIHQRMIAEITACGGRIDRVIYCPHRPEDNCYCRKPKPGMLLQVAQDMNIDLPRSYFIGDAATDLMAAQQVGCRAFLVMTGRGFQQLEPALQAMSGQFSVARDLKEAATQIIKAEAQRVHSSAHLMPAF